MRERERAQQMLRIMIDRIKEAQTDVEKERRQYRVAGAIFILYFLDIITFEEHRQYEDEIYKA